MPDHHFYEPKHGHGLKHDPLNAIIGPRPIGWISSIGADGVRNLAPYSFFNLFAYRPPIIGFSSTGRKHSLANIEATGEFVWNLATRDLAEAVNHSSATVGPEIDEFELAGVESLPSLLVKPDRVAESPVTFECRHTQTLRLEAAHGRPIDQWVVFGEVIGVHINPALLDDGIYRTARARPILRGGGPDEYFEITEDRLFRMKRPA